MEGDSTDKPQPQGAPGAPSTTADYLSLREIGVGSYGRVWLVKDRTSGEYCAVKIIYRHLFEDERPYDKERAGVQRFSDLSKASRTLLRIIHVGLHDGEGYFYYLMELADDRQPGQAISPANYAPRTLKWELEKTGHRERLPAEDCLRIMLSLTAGLEELHSGGLIHRDIKPANIIFVKGEPKLADIGLVTSKDLTRTIVSTPGYFREGEPQTERSDIYGLGKVLYEILTGLDRRDDVDFPRLPEGIRGWPDRQLALGLNEVVSKACARSPRKRYQSAREMRADLERLEQGKSVGSGLRSALASVRSPLFTAASVTLLLLLGLAGWKWGWKPRSTRQDLPPVKRALASPTKHDTWTNSLGMKFVPVAGTKACFCIWDTRVQDFQSFVDATGYDATEGMISQVGYAYKQQGNTWKSPGFSQGPAHPVCGVAWNDAKAFCQWLTQKERTSGLISKDHCYRLPTDEEWSIAVGLGKESVGTPKDKSLKNRDAFPWGTQWPPPRGTGNYDPSERLDNYRNTSPVGSFEANRYGLYDMGGNVRNWCEDEIAPGTGRRVLRGASWGDYNMGSLLSSRRFTGAPDLRLVRNGFRCVLGTAEGSLAQVAGSLSKQPTGASPTSQLLKNQPLASATAGQSEATQRHPWTNSLGLPFVPVPGMKALFCIWDVRVQDYQPFVDSTLRVWRRPAFAQGPRHPAVNVSWEDAKGFCEWLTREETASGHLRPPQTYRLPTDAEWSKAVGLDEDYGGTPREKDKKIEGVYPWGTAWPPPRGAGNYRTDLSVDDFPNTSPVGRFRPNRYGLYDMGGNVWQWCEDWYDGEGKDHVARGGSWLGSGAAMLLSSARYHGTPRPLGNHGFRVVLAGASGP